MRSHLWALHSAKACTCKMRRQGVFINCNSAHRTSKIANGSYRSKHALKIGEHRVLYEYSHLAMALIVQAG